MDAQTLIRGALASVLIFGVLLILFELASLAALAAGVADPIGRAAIAAGSAAIILLSLAYFA